MAVPVGETSKRTALFWGTAQARLPRRPQEPTAKSSLLQTVFQHGPLPPPSQAGSRMQTVLLHSTGSSQGTPQPQDWGSTPLPPLAPAGRQPASPSREGRPPPTTGVAQYNIAIGLNTLYANTSGIENTALGASTLRFNTSGNYNTALGANALNANTSGAENTAIGESALTDNTTADYNVAVGSNALVSNTTGFENTALGTSALFSNVAGDYNTAVGTNALYYNTDAASTTAVGNFAGLGTGSYSNKGGVYLGFKSGFKSGTGSDYNTLLGFQSGYNITTGYGNVLVGPSVTAGNLTTGRGNVGLGNELFFH